VPVDLTALRPGLPVPRRSDIEVSSAVDHISRSEQPGGPWESVAKTLTILARALNTYQWKQTRMICDALIAIWQYGRGGSSLPATDRAGKLGESCVRISSNSPYSLDW